jgi:hypothetical protein
MNNPKSHIEIVLRPYPSVDDLLQQLSPVPSSKSSIETSPESTVIKSQICPLADQLWRLGGIIFEGENREVKDGLNGADVRKLARSLEAMEAIIESIGIRVIDRCDQDWDAGLPETVITEEPKEGISKERILRTIRPTIMWNQTMVQRGEIDIAVPTAKNDEK